MILARCLHRDLDVALAAGWRIWRREWQLSRQEWAYLLDWPHKGEPPELERSL